MTPPETASNLPLVLTVLTVPPVLGSGFGPSGSLPVGLRWCAEHQPFSPFIETVRGLLLGTPLGWYPVLAVSWALLLAAVGHTWAVLRYERRPGRPG